jgi:hypothetical protein
LGEHIASGFFPLSFFLFFSTTALRCFSTTSNWAFGSSLAFLAFYEMAGYGWLSGFMRSRRWSLTSAWVEFCPARLLGLAVFVLVFSFVRRSFTGGADADFSKNNEGDWKKNGRGLIAFMMDVMDVMALHLLYFMARQ